MLTFCQKIYLKSPTIYLCSVYVISFVSQQSFFHSVCHFQFISIQSKWRCIFEMMMEVFLSLLTFSQRRPQIDSALLYSSIFQKFKLNNSSIPLTLVQFCSYLPFSKLHNKTMRERKLNCKKDIIKKCKNFFKFLHYLTESTIYYENIFLHFTLRIQIVGGCLAFCINTSFF